MSTDNKRRFNFYLVQAVVFLLLLAGILIIIAGFIPLRSSLFQKQAEKMARKYGADSCTVEIVEVTAWKSIILRNAFFHFKIDKKRSCTVRCKEMNISGSVINLYLMRDKIKNHIRKNKKALMNHFKDKPEQAVGFFYKSGKTILKNRGISCSGTAVSLKDGKKETISLKNGTFSFAEKGKKGESLQVNYKLASVAVLGDGIENVSGNCSIDNQGMIKIALKKGTYCDGTVSAEGTIALNERMIKKYLVNIINMDFNYWYTMHVGVGSITGRANIRATGQNRSLKEPYPVDSISLLLSDSKIEKLPVQQSLATSLFLPELSSLQFTALKCSVVFDTTDTISAKIKGEGPDLNFTSNGWSTVSGKMQYRMDGTFTREKVKRFPAVVRKMLVPAPKGGGKFGCRIYGKLSDPRFELDKETLQRAIGSMFDDFKDEIIKMYR